MTLVLPLSVSASGALSQGFQTDDKNVVAGSVVSLKSDGQDAVEAATSDHALQLVGIVADKPLVSLGSDGNQVQVVTSGVTPVQVSDINGTIKVGDKLTASPLSGIGMKAVESSEIFGTAQSSLSSGATTSHNVTDKLGKTKQVKVGTVLVQVNVSYYSAQQDKLQALVPSFLIGVGSTIAGKDLSPLRVLISFMCLLVGFIVVGIMLQAAIRSGIISIGRNPLAHDALRRSLVDVLLTSVGVLVITIVVFYLILTT